MKTKTTIIWIVILVFIDQLVKILINYRFGELHFEIIPSLIEFKPTFNAKHSWVNGLMDKYFGINAGLIPHIVLYILIGVMVPVYFSFYRNKIAPDKKLIDTAIIFMMAAILCALIGNIFWAKGTLDYIYLKSFFVFDLKDVFIDIGVVIFLFYAFRNRKSMDQLMKVKMRDVFKEAKITIKHSSGK
jgi:lipoprotein signal peptidase